MIFQDEKDSSFKTAVIFAIIKISVKLHATFEIIVSSLRINEIFSFQMFLYMPGVNISYQCFGRRGFGNSE